MEILNNRWNLYEILKGNFRYTINDIERMDLIEIKEGVIEYLLSQSHCAKL